jgi:hypothetical protein
LSPRVRTLLGLVTTAVFGILGSTLYGEGQRTLGAILCGLAVLRLVHVFSQLRGLSED